MSCDRRPVRINSMIRILPPFIIVKRCNIQLIENTSKLLKTCEGIAYLGKGAAQRTCSIVELGNKESANRRNV